MEFIEGPHHALIGQVLDDVLEGRRNRVIITIPPGYTKTELAVINFMARGFSRNPKARFIHATFSDQLAGENSQAVKELVEMEQFLDLGQVTLRADSKAKGRWKTDQGGGLLAKAAGGPITGFRAGYMDKSEFTGALIVDDPLKPDDAFSPEKRKNVNRRATNTFRSRLAHDEVPIVVIMQRLHADDFVGHLLTGGTGDIWDHLDLPVLINHGQEYPAEWTHGRPIPHDLPEGPLWEEKHNLEEIRVIEADAYTFASQYMQRPASMEGALFHMPGFVWYNEGELGPIDHFCMYADTAQKKGERNDYSVIQLWAKLKDGRIALIDQVRGKWTAPELLATARAFWKKHTGKIVRGLKVEDKSSGTGLIQELQQQNPPHPAIPVYAIQRERDKYTRGLDVAPWIATGQVLLPKGAEFEKELTYELQTFDGLGTGFDDQVDPLMDAVNEMLGSYSNGWEGTL